MYAKLWPLADPTIVHRIFILGKKIVNIFLIAMDLEASNVDQFHYCLSKFTEDNLAGQNLLVAGNHWKTTFLERAGELRTISLKKS
jgi:hypothetical protein